MKSRHRAVRWALCWALSVLACGLTTGAHAHGEGASILGVAAVDEQGAPWLVRTGEGLVVRDEEGLWFLCPAATGLEGPPLVAGDAEGAWLVGVDGPVFLDRGGLMQPLADADFTANRVLAVAAHAGQVYGLAQSASGSGVVVGRFDRAGVTVVYRSERPFTDLKPGPDALWLAAFDNGRVQVSVLSPGESAGPDALVEPMDWPEIPLPAAVVDSRPALGLRIAGAQTYVLSVGGSTRELFRLTPDSLTSLRSTSQPLHGPVLSERDIYLLDGNALLRLDAAALEAVATDVVLTGLDAAGGRAFAAAVGDLYRVPLSSQARPVLSFEGLRPPPPGLTEGRSEDAPCQAQWLRFTADLTRAGYTPGAWRDPHTLGSEPSVGMQTDAGTDDGLAMSGGAPDGGCAIGGPGACPRWLLLVYGLGLVRRRLLGACRPRKRRGGLGMTAHRGVDGLLE